MMNSFFLFFNISGGELLVIALVVYLVFGPKKIPEIARMLGKGINEIRRATDDIKREITKETANIKKTVDMGIDMDDPLKTKPEAPKNKQSKPRPNYDQDKDKNPYPGFDQEEEQVNVDPKKEEKPSSPPEQDEDLK